MPRGYIIHPTQFDHTALEKGQEILVINHAEWYKRARGCAPPPRYSRAFYRFGILTDQAQADNNRIVLPMEQHAWALCSGNSIAGPSWKTMRSPIILLTGELRDGWLDADSTRHDLPRGMPLDWRRREVGRVHDEKVQSEKIEVFAGGAVGAYFKEQRCWDYWREEKKMKMTCHEEARLCAGLAPAQDQADRERELYTRKSDLAQRIEEIYRIGGPGLSGLLCEAKRLGMLTENVNYPSRDGLIITPMFLEQLCRRQRSTRIPKIRSARAIA